MSLHSSVDVDGRCNACRERGSNRLPAPPSPRYRDRSRRSLQHGRCDVYDAVRGDAAGENALRGRRAHRGRGSCLGGDQRLVAARTASARHRAADRRFHRTHRDGHRQCRCACEADPVARARSSRPRTQPGGGSSETSTTKPSSGSSPWRSNSAWRSFSVRFEPDECIRAAAGRETLIAQSAPPSSVFEAVTREVGFEPRPARPRLARCCCQAPATDRTASRYSTRRFSTAMCRSSRTMTPGSQQPPSRRWQAARSTSAPWMDSASSVPSDRVSSPTLTEGVVAREAPASRRDLVAGGPASMPWPGSHSPDLPGNGPVSPPRRFLRPKNARHGADLRSPSDKITSPLRSAGMPV